MARTKDATERHGAAGRLPLALPRGRHGLSSVGRKRALLLAARHTRFMEPFLRRQHAPVAVHPIEQHVRERQRLLTPAPPLLGHYATRSAFFAALLARYAEAPIYNPDSGHRHALRYQRLFRMLAGLTGAPRSESGQAGAERIDDPWSAATIDALLAPLAAAAPSMVGRTARPLADGAAPPLVPAVKPPAEMVLSPLVAELASAATSGLSAPGAEARPGIWSRQLLGRAEWQPSFLAAGALPLSVARDLPQPPDDEGDVSEAVDPGRPVVAPPVAAVTMLPQLFDLLASIQRKAAGGGPPAARQRLHALQRAGASRGTPLSAARRAPLEHALGADFSTVRLHTDTPAAEASAALAAQAFTLGRDVYFAAGAYQPESAAGLALLGHELVHTLQQPGVLQRRAQGGSVLGEEEPAGLEAQAQQAEARLLGLFTPALRVPSPSQVPDLAQTLASRATIPLHNGHDTGDAVTAELYHGPDATTVVQRTTTALGGVVSGLEERLARAAAGHEYGQTAAPIGPGVGAFVQRQDLGAAVSPNGASAPATGSEQTTVAAAASEHTNGPADAHKDLDVDELMDKVISRLKRELALDIDRTGGFLSDLMR